jgi:hypothetical protein
MALPDLPKPTVGILVIIAALLGIVLIIRQTIIRSQPEPGRVASAILAGKAQARANLTYEAEDGDLLDDEAAAGAMWAKAHGADNSGECPLYSAAFRKGCGDYIRDQGQ